MGKEIQGLHGEDSSIRKCQHRNIGRESDTEINVTGGNLGLRLGEAAENEANMRY